MSEKTQDYTFELWDVILDWGVDDDVVLAVLAEVVGEQIAGCSDKTKFERELVRFTKEMTTAARKVRKVLRR